jgi:hypothetical protein
MVPVSALSPSHRLRTRFLKTSWSAMTHGSRHPATTFIMAVQFPENWISKQQDQQAQEA